MPTLPIAMTLALAFGDAPKVPELWLYHATNLLVDANVEKAGALLDRAAKAGYRRMLLADSKLSRLADMDERYFRNARRLLERAKADGIAIVPAIFPIGYSEGLLSRDPNLAEALPVRDAEFVVQDGRARPVPDRVALVKPEWKDDCFAAEGGADGGGARGAWRCKDPAGANARLVFRVKTKPWHGYHVAATIETKEFDGEPRVQALVDGKSGTNGSGLVFSNLGCKATQPATVHHAVFDSFEHEEVLLYVGAWGATKGELAVRDVAIESAGLVNLVRRPGAPFELRREEAAGAPTRAALVEGVDYEPVRDPAMGVNPWPGSFDVWHEPPAIRTKLPDGTRLRADFSVAITVLDGQVMICPSEPRTNELLADEIHRVAELFGRDAFFLSHDEIRVLGQDDACRRRKLDAGALLAANVRDCVAIARKEAPRADLWIWSDMFDPNHNAHAGYYLVRGDLAGSWEGLDRGVGVAAWYFEQREKSLPFFAQRGHRLLLAAYYDVPAAALRAQVAGWLDAAKRAGGADAVMYTTWQSRYDELEPFAKYVQEGR